MKYSAMSFFVAVIFLYTGCTHTHRNCAPQSLNDEFHGKRVRITAIDGTATEANSVRIAADSTYWLNGLSNSFSFSNAGIRCFVIKSRWRGAIEGLGIGIVVGGLMGFIAGHVEGDDSRSSFISFSAGDKAKMYGMGLAFYGGLAGIPIGAFIASRDRYNFQEFLVDTVR
jgi:hypothetical protein